MIEITDINLKETIARLQAVPDKDTWKTTTTRIFKLNIAQFLCRKPKKKIVELGAAQGHTSYFISPLASKVLAIDYDQKNCDLIKDLKCDNVDVLQEDLYSSEFTAYMKNQQFDVAIIDAVHVYDNVKKDISNAKLAGVKDFIFDDYGAFPDVKRAVDEFINDEIKNNRKVTSFVIGMPPGSNYPNTSFQILKDWEGIIVSID